LVGAESNVAKKNHDRFFSFLVEHCQGFAKGWFIFSIEKRRRRSGEM